MNPGDALTLAGVVLLLGFIVFAFRQGARVKPDKDARDRSQAYDPGHDGFGGHGGHGGGH